MWIRGRGGRASGKPTPTPMPAETRKKVYIRHRPIAGVDPAPPSGRAAAPMVCRYQGHDKRDTQVPCTVDKRTLRPLATCVSVGCSASRPWPPFSASQKFAADSDDRSTRRIRQFSFRARRSSRSRGPSSEIAQLLSLDGIQNDQRRIVRSLKNRRRS